MVCAHYLLYHVHYCRHLPLRTEESGVEALVGVHLGFVGSGLGAGRETCRVKSSGEGSAGLLWALGSSGSSGSGWFRVSVGWLVVE